MQRRGVQLAGLVAASVIGTSAPAVAQSGGGRAVEPDARILVATFRSTDRGLGVQGADAIRSRVSQEVPQRQLLVIRKEDINGTLAASGYAADSALSPSDMKELAKLMRADEILDGTVTKTADGVRVDARLLLARDVALAQPLPPATARNVGEAARAISRDLKEARKQLAANKRCENHLRERQYDQAIAASREGTAAYPQATLTRLCLVSALREQKTQPDAIITAANEVLAIDPNSRIALGILYEAQTGKGDNDGAMATLTRMLRADPTNPQLRQQVAIEFAKREPARALPILQPLVEENPGDVEMIKLLWAVQLRAQQYKGAIATGENLARLDTSVVDTLWFTRMIAAYSADSQPQRAVEIAGRQVQRYPRSAAAHAVFGQTLRRAGQLPQAAQHYEQAVRLDPKVEPGYLALVVTQCELNQPDAAFASSDAAVKSGLDKATIGNALMGCAAPAMRAAQDQKTRASWQRAYDISNRIDQVAPSANSKFFVGVSSFQVGLDALQNLNKSKSCAEAELIETMWAAAQIAMPQGASVDRNAAGQIMGVIQQYSPNVAQAKKSLCTGRRR